MGDDVLTYSRAESNPIRLALIISAILSTLWCAAAVVAWIASYSPNWKFMGGGLEAGVGDYWRTYADGLYEYRDADSHIRFHFWQLTAVSLLLSAVFWFLASRRTRTKHCVA